MNSPSCFLVTELLYIRLSAGKYLVRREITRDKKSFFTQSFPCKEYCVRATMVNLIRSGDSVCLITTRWQHVKVSPVARL